jgi:hypothetical protein
MTLDLSPDELLSTTRAVRKRLDLERPVERDVLLDCVELAVQAPSGSNNVTMSFVVVCDANRKPLRVLTGGTNWTFTGLCTQANNGLIIDDPAVAQDVRQRISRTIDLFHGPASEIRLIVLDLEKQLPDIPRAGVLVDGPVQLGAVNPRHEDDRIGRCVLIHPRAHLLVRAAPERHEIL